MIDKSASEGQQGEPQVSGHCLGCRKQAGGRNFLFFVVEHFYTFKGKVYVNGVFMRNDFALGWRNAHAARGFLCWGCVSAANRRVTYSVAALVTGLLAPLLCGVALNALGETLPGLGAWACPLFLLIGVAAGAAAVGVLSALERAGVVRLEVGDKQLPPDSSLEIALTRRVAGLRWGEIEKLHKERFGSPAPIRDPERERQPTLRAYTPAEFEHLCKNMRASQPAAAQFKALLEKERSPAPRG